MPPFCRELTTVDEIVELSGRSLPRDHNKPIAVEDNLLAPQRTYAAPFPNGGGGSVGGEHQGARKRRSGPIGKATTLFHGALQSSPKPRAILRADRRGTPRSIHPETTET